ncbi:MAG: hypothetical protein ACREHD_04835 [Pirellulales bacterium]
MREFEYTRFLALPESELYAYVQPVLNPRSPLPQDVLQRMFSELPTYDEVRSVYAIELGPDRAPDLFAPVLPRYLSHKSQAVRCSASRALNRLPDRLITKELVDAARAALSSCPDEERAIWAAVLDGLEKRVA